MRWPFTKYEAFYAIIMLYLMFDVILAWNAYNECYAPIQLFLVMTYGAMMVTRFILILLSAPDLPNWANRGLTFFLHWIMNPFLIYLPIQGIVWQIENMVKSSGCIPPERLPYFIWLWLVCLLLLTILISLMSFLRLRNWIRMRLFRRRMAHFQELIQRGDYEALNQLLLGEGDINNRVGLLEADFNRIPVQEYSQSLTQMLSLSHLQECPICFEDYKNGDQVMVLPKCKHAFHPECIKGWLVKSPLCPMCRANVRTNLYSNIQGRGQEGYAPPVNPNGLAARNQDLENPVVNSH